MARNLPGWIGNALAHCLEGVSRTDLSARARAMSERYRGSRDSSGIEAAPDALAYACARMPATYAAARAALGYAAELAGDFAPASLLDVGAGPGTATWASLDLWPSLRRASLIDRNAELLGLAARLAEAAAVAETKLQFIHATIPERLQSAEPCDLVVASYALTELSEPAALSAVAALWRLTDKMLVLVEPGTPRGFARLMTYRAALIAEAAHILAPCTHESICPLAGAQRWCHFSERLARSREHLAVKGVDVPFEDERFSYLAVARSLSRSEAVRRVLATPRVTKASVQLTLCAPKETEEWVVERRSGGPYKAAKRMDWGEAIRAGDCELCPL